MRKAYKCWGCCNGRIFQGNNRPNNCLDGHRNYGVDKEQYRQLTNDNDFGPYGASEGTPFPVRRQVLSVTVQQSPGSLWVFDLYWPDVH